jgi:hypothetical protein
MYRLLGLFIILILVVSCDTGFNSKGLVIDKSTQLPIDNVKIDIKGKGTTYTDSLGYYKIDTMIYGYAGNLEILLNKDGYKTKHVNFKTDKIEMNNALIELEKLGKSTVHFCIEKKRISQLYYFNMYFISLFNLLTLLFLLFKKKIRGKILWILGVILFNLTILISFTDCSISDFKLINSPIPLTHYWIHPYSIKIVIPVFAIIFWGIYLIKKKALFKNENRNA